MFRLFLNLLLLILIFFGIYTYFNSQKIFEAKFKNIDGLPIGAKVTALGTRIGEIIKAKPVNDGVIVTVRITNKNFAGPEPGSQLVITSFRPGQGRVLEVIPPGTELPENKAWIIQEPVTAESWLQASLDLLENLKEVSKVIVREVTPQNFQKARTAFTRANESLSETAQKLSDYGKNLSRVNEKFASKTSETSQLLMRLYSPVKTLNQIISDKEFQDKVGVGINEFSGSISKISEKIASEQFHLDITSFKQDILDNLNNVNSSLINIDNEISNPVLRGKIKDFNEHIVSLNEFYRKLTKDDLNKVKEAAKKAKDLTTKASELTKQN